MQSQQRRPERDEAFSLPQRTRRSATLTIASLLFLSACAPPSSASALSAADFRAAAENASIRATAAIDAAADAVSDFFRALINRFASADSLSAAREKTVPITTPAARPATTTIIYQTITQPVIERVAERGTVLGASTDTEALPAQVGVTRDELDAAMRSQFGLLSASIGANAFVSTPTFAQSQRIDTLSNIVLNGVSGLTDADIPDGITASNYLLLTGGTLSGDFAVTGNFTVAGAQTLSGAITIPYLVATSSTASSFVGNLGVGTSTPWALLSVNPNGISGPAFVIGSSTATNFVVTNAGLVGIGTASPGKTLDVNGDIQLSNILYLTRGGYTGSIYSNGSGLYLGTSDTLTVGTSNNVGIGNIFPSYKLDVTGNGHFTSLVDAANFVATSSSATSTFAGGLAVETSGLVYDYSSNRVGIGTAAPTAKLFVLGSNAGGPGTAAQFALGDSPSLSTGKMLQLGYDTTSDFGWLQSVNWGDGYKNLILNQNGGNVGLATTSPWRTLSVHGSSDLGSSALAGYFTGTSTSIASTFGYRVGIGVTGPAAALEVSVTSSNATLLQEVARLSRTGGTNAAAGNGRATLLSFYDTANETLTAAVGGVRETPEVTYDGALAFYTNNSGSVTNVSSLTERLRITSAGNVGIGQTTPNQGKVEVKGDTVCVDTNSDDNATSCIASESDGRLKENIETLDASASLDTLLKLNPVSFYWRATDPEVLKHYPLIARFASSPHSVGLIAQDVQPLFPLAIDQETVGDSEVQYFQLDYTKFIPLIISGVKELARRLDELVSTVSRFADRFTTRELSFERATGESLTADRLCLEDVCITKAELQLLLDRANAPAASSPLISPPTPESPPADTADEDAPVAELPEADAPSLEIEDDLQSPIVPDLPATETVSEAPSADTPTPSAE